MRRTTRIFALVAAVLGMLGVLSGAAGAAPAGTSGPVSPTARTADVDGCPDGFSCYYDFPLARPMYIAPSCGFKNLGDLGLNDRTSSIVNLGRGAIQPYNWDGVSSWIPVGAPVQVGQVKVYFGDEDNIIDAISIAC